MEYSKLPLLGSRRALRSQMRHARSRNPSLTPVMAGIVNSIASWIGCTRERGGPPAQGTYVEMNAGSVHPSCTREADKEAACDCGEGSSDRTTAYDGSFASARARREEIREEWMQRCFLFRRWLDCAPAELLIVGFRDAQSRWIHVDTYISVGEWVALLIVRGSKQFPIFGARFDRCEEISGRDGEVWKLASVVVEVVMGRVGLFRFDISWEILCFLFSFFLRGFDRFWMSLVEIFIVFCDLNIDFRNSFAGYCLFFERSIHTWNADWMYSWIKM